MTWLSVFDKLWPWPIRVQKKIKVKGQLDQKIDRNGRTDTTDCCTLLANAEGNYKVRLNSFSIAPIRRNLWASVTKSEYRYLHISLNCAGWYASVGGSFCRPCTQESEWSQSDLSDQWTTIQLHDAQEFSGADQTIRGNISRGAVGFTADCLRK